LVVQHLSTGGDGTGVVNATGTYTPGSPGRFYLQPAAGTVVALHRIMPFLRDSAMLADRYGNIANGLTNGVLLKVFRDGVEELDLFDGVPVKTNAGWGHFMYDISFTTSLGAGDVFMAGRYTMSKFGGPLILEGDETDTLEFICQDTLTDLVTHTMIAQGTVYTAGIDY